jgi:hypothetical protein
LIDEPKLGGKFAFRGRTWRIQMEDINQSLAELWDAATALHDLVEKASSTLPAENARPIVAAIGANASIIEAIEARWGKDVWERHRKSRTG